MRADYGECYRELYERHWWWRAREALILQMLRALKPPQGWKRILDVGCGDGLFFDRLSQFGDVQGVEPAEELVSDRGRYRSRIHIGPFDENFQPAQQFSLILMLDVLEHLPDPCGALRHALALLEPDGRLVATVPAYQLLWTNHDILNHHLTRYTARSFRHVARRAGLEIESEKYFFHWLFPVKLVVRLAQRVLRLHPKPPNVPARWVNELVYRLSRIESKALGFLSLPFGSSLMVVGKKQRQKVNSN